MSGEGKQKITAEMRADWDRGLRVAAGRGDIEEIRRLRNLGANMKGADENGWTVLHWAAMRGHVEICKYLLDCGADRNVRNNQDKLPVDLCKPCWSNAYKYCQAVLTA